MSVLAPAYPSSLFELFHWRSNVTGLSGGPSPPQTTRSAEEVHDKRGSRVDRGCLSSRKLAFSRTDQRAVEISKCDVHDHLPPAHSPWRQIRRAPSTALFASPHLKRSLRHGCSMGITLAGSTVLQNI